MFKFLRMIFGTAQERKVRSYYKIVAAVNSWDQKYQSLSDDELKAKTAEFKDRYQQGETLEKLLPEAYGAVKNVCRRLCGLPIHVSGYDQQWDMIPYDVQLVGAIAMHHGCIAEMQTGEGKTLTAVLPLYLNALTGKPVHLVTVNDYLAQRDCEWVGTILRWLGLTTGSLTGSTPNEERKQIYAADVVYGTASEFGFDYLRDNSMAVQAAEQVQRGYYFSIIDEVDSILIDEARTPLIISGPVPVSRQMYDELKVGVAHLVRLQRDYCNQLATAARKILEETPVGDKKREKERQEALKQLWLVGKGTPRNKILKRIKEDPDLRAAIDKWDLYYYNDQNKEEKQHAIAQLYITVDEKASEFELTDKGIAAWAAYAEGKGSSDDFVMMDLSDAFIQIDNDPSLSEEEKVAARLKVQEEDAVRKERAHNLRQLLRAHLLMERDVDYMVHDAKIVIVDEHTGRPQPGRRFADGLHQAIEAKESVPIQRETQTYATVTLQNYFRLYTKISGMTGTATTEANEFKEIYKLDVLEIPTHRKCVRTDAHDEIYMTEREKYNALLKDIRDVHGQGRPILLGTESVEVSEKLSRILRQNQLEHTVLNAKNNANEAEIVARAGQRGAITVSTNMAGRGTDIKLGPGIADIGGLYVIGTTRHQSRRIDRQLRGRSARQGDPGSSKFYVSFEDALLRLFTSPTLIGMIQRFRPEEGEPISARMLDKSIETAQKRVEQRNYTIRKHTLEYDDVMNKQRQEIYDFRNDLLSTSAPIALAEELLENVCLTAAEKHLDTRTEEGWDPEGYRQFLLYHFPISFEEGYFDEPQLSLEELAARAYERVLHAFREKLARESAKPIPGVEGERPAQAVTERAVRDLMVRKMDHHWQEHLLAMDHLRADVSLRAVGQRDPLTEFKREAFELFDALGATLRREIAQDLFRFEIIVRQPQMSLEQLFGELHLERNRSFLSEAPPLTEVQNEPEPVDVPERLTPIIATPKVGRNDPCPCGSGKKYKKCCGITEEELAPEERVFSS